mgnify:CR=1 FL=1
MSGHAPGTTSTPASAQVRTASSEAAPGPPSPWNNQILSMPQSMHSRTTPTAWSALTTMMTPSSAPGTEATSW